jgi:hypothetical protein
MTNSYVYKITNKITNNFYIGYRSKNQKLNRTPQEDIWIKYFTSSKRIKTEIETYGTDAFNVDIISENIDPMLCWRLEQQLIKESWGNSLLLNARYHDPESDVEVYRRINTLTEESRRKMSLSAKGKPKTESHRKKIAESNTGKPQSDEKRRKISEARKGKPTNKGVSPPKFNCVHCGKLVSNANLHKWHNDRCKSINPDRFNQIAEQIKNLRKHK